MGRTGTDAPTERRRRGVRLTQRVFWDLAVYMVGLGVVVGVVFPPFAVWLGVPPQTADRPLFVTACLAAGVLVGGLSYAVCRVVVGGRLSLLSARLRTVADGIAQASRTGDWSQSTPQRIDVDSDDPLGQTAQAFNSLLDSLEDGEHFRALVRNASDVITVVDRAGVITYQTPSVGWVLGHPPGALIGTAVHDLLHPEDLPGFRARLAEVAAGSEHTACPGARMRHRNGTWRWTETVVANLLTDPAVNGLVLTTRDVGDRRELEEQLRAQAFHDPLTGLPNRALFMERLRAAEAGERDGVPAAVLSWTWTTSRPPTTTSGTTPGTPCCRWWPAGSVACCAPGTPSPGWPATSSPSCWSGRAALPRHRGWPSGCWPSSRSRWSSSTAPSAPA